MALPTHITSPAVRNVLNGRYAECSIAIGAGADAVLVFLFDWKLSMNADHVNLTAAGDRWKVFVPVDCDWRATARGYIAPGAVTSYISQGISSGVPTPLTFRGWTAAVGTSPTNLIWSGVCWIKSGEISAPMGLVEQSFEVMGTGQPTAGI